MGAYYITKFYSSTLFMFPRSVGVDVTTPRTTGPGPSLASDRECDGVWLVFGWCLVILR